MQNTPTGAWKQFADQASTILGKTSLNFFSWPKQSWGHAGPKGLEARERALQHKYAACGRLAESPKAASAGPIENRAQNRA